MIQDRQIGATIIILSVIFWIYYGIWIFVGPAMNQNSMFFYFFPPISIAYLIPSCLLVFFMTLWLLFWGVSLINESMLRRKERLEQSKEKKD